MTYAPGYSEAAARNEQAILGQLEKLLIDGSRVLEIGCGTGQHAVAFAQALPKVTWMPCDREFMLDDMRYRWREAGLANLHEPRALDLLEGQWPALEADAVIACNVIHIAPWAATGALFEGAARVLTDEGRVILYGPYRYETRAFEPSNASFDASLRARDPEMGIRLFEDVEKCAGEAGFVCDSDTPMPANNRFVVWRRQ